MVGGPSTRSVFARTGKSDKPELLRGAHPRPRLGPDLEQNSRARSEPWLWCLPRRPRSDLATPSVEAGTTHSTELGKEPSAPKNSAAWRRLALFVAMACLGLAV